MASQASTLPGVEILVRVVELLCKDDGVRSDIASKLTKIDFVNQRPDVVAESKSFSMIENGMLYNCVLGAGTSGRPHVL